MTRFLAGLILGLAALVFWKIGVIDPKITELQATISSHEKGMQELAYDNEVLRRLVKRSELSSSSH